MSKKPDSLKQAVIDAWRHIKHPSDRIDVVDQLQALVDSKNMEDEVSQQSVVDSEELDQTSGHISTNHWLLKGDILEKLEVPYPVDLVFTSPPYNADIKYDVYHDKKSLDDFLKFLWESFEQIDSVVKPGGRVVINIRNITVGSGERYPIIVHFYDHLCKSLGYKFRGEHVWYKGREESSTAWGSYRSSNNPAVIDLYEWIFVFQKDGEHQHGTDSLDKSEFIESVIGVWKIRPVKKIFAGKKNRLEHPCPFPIELAKRVIRLYSCVGDTVLDPFAGIGSTAIAAAQSDRHSVSYDISEKYRDLSIKYFKEQIYGQRGEKTSGDFFRVLAKIKKKI